MNRFENWFCSTSYWRRTTEHKLLPWILEGISLGGHVLELGAGPGAATEALHQRAGQVTSLEYSHEFAARLAARVKGKNIRVVQGDASVLPFANASFSTVIAVLMLHHLKSPALQDAAFAEIARVLQPSGFFVAFEIEDSWLHRFGHIKSVFTPLSPASAKEKLSKVGFSDFAATTKFGGFRFRAVKRVVS